VQTPVLASSAVGLLVLATLIHLLPAKTAVTEAQQDAKLRAAIGATNDLDDERARVLFDDLLASKPPDRIAAQAYLYLGVLDYNALDKTNANEALRRALELDPTLEAPPKVSPKIALVIEELRRKLVQKLRADAAQAPAASVSPPPVVVEREVSHPRVWPWVLGAAAVAAGAVSVWGWVEVANFEGLKGPTPVTPAQAQSAQAAAQWGQPVGIVTAIAAAGLLAGTVLTW
jgi:hypothetical protein